MSEHWEFYFTKVDEQIASTFVDLGIREEVPIPGVSDLVWLRVHMRAPRPDGL